MRDLKVFRVRGGNSLAGWHKIKNPLVVCMNFLVIYLCRILPFLSLKRFLLRSVGVKIGKNVSVGMMAMFDIFWPELIAIGDNTIIGYNAIILGHEFLIKEYRLGRVRVGRSVIIGANATILPGVTIGDNAVVSACSLVNSDVPSGSFVGGIPAREIKRAER